MGGTAAAGPTCSFESLVRGRNGQMTMVVLGLGLAAFLAIAGITFVSLAVAFPIAIAAVDQYNLYVSASDLALAAQFSTYAPAFFVAGIASLVAALVTIVKLIQRIDRGPAA